MEGDEEKTMSIFVITYLQPTDSHRFLRYFNDFRASSWGGINNSWLPKIGK